MLEPIEAANLDITNDTKILACAIDYDSRCHPDETIFVTNDLSLRAIAQLFFGTDSIQSVKENVDEYKGYKDVVLDNDKMADYYMNLNINHFDLLINEYVNIYNSEGELVDTACWTGETHRPLTKTTFTSSYLGDIKPLKGDNYQRMFYDSLINNQITMVKGPAGSGKTIGSLGFLFYMLQKGKIDRIVIFCNTVATKGSARLGYYPGSKDEKLLDSQIGNLLSSKLGGMDIVQQLINQESLILMPMSDIRGYDTSDMNAGIYISEAQNMDISLLKLALQRIGKDSICIIDGDCRPNNQVDDKMFEGSNNGMRRASKVFRGSDIYGEVELKTIHRSKIAELAEEM